MTARMHDEVSVVTGVEGGQASAALFLASDEPSCATGADFVVDAGGRA